MTQRKAAYCSQCEAPIGKGKTRPRRYCSDACRQAAYRKRNALDGFCRKYAPEPVTPGQEGQNTPLGASESRSKQEICNAAYPDTSWAGYDLTNGQGEPVTEALVRAAFLARHGFEPEKVAMTGGCWLAGPIAENGR